MLIDSNILIYALNDASPKQAVAKSYLLKQQILIFAQQNILETLRILTHHRFPTPFSSSQALQALESITNEARILSSNADAHALTLNLIEKYSITGTEIFDAALVATALSHGVTSIATDNTKHLGKYTEISVFNPF